MLRDLQRYHDRTVILVYLDRKGRFTQRTVQLRLIQSGIVRAYDVDKQSTRTFRIENIMTVQPVIRHAV